LFYQQQLLSAASFDTDSGQSMWIKTLKRNNHQQILRC